MCQGYQRYQISVFHLKAFFFFFLLQYLWVGKYEPLTFEMVIGVPYLLNVRVLFAYYYYCWCESLVTGLCMFLSRDDESGCQDNLEEEHHCGVMPNTPLYAKVSIEIKLLLS